MRLHRFDYSPYARFVQAAVELAKVPCELVDVRYGEREELARLTGGYIMVPVLERDDGPPLCDSRVIMSTLTREDPRFAALVPSAEAGPIWAYVDWACSSLEDVAFRIASPGVSQRFGTAFERALYVFVKERKFGTGCVDQWAAEARQLNTRMQALLEPTLDTLARRSFLFGDAPTLADCALYGIVAMLDLGAPNAIAHLPEPLHAWRLRFEARVGPPPYGRVARAHHDRAELDARLANAAAGPRTGRLELIVVRTATHERATPAQAELSLQAGVAGDRWADGDKKESAQVSLMDTRVAAALGAREDWPLFGDNLFVDFDLGLGSLVPGDRFTIGEALLELTDEPHLGCRKMAARFGREALLWVNQKRTRDERRRGVFARVLRAGTVKLGDPLGRA